MHNLHKTSALSIRTKSILFIAVWLVSFGIISFGISKTGQTWDEIPYFNAGREYIKSASQLDFSMEAWRANKEHPGFAKYIYGPASLSAYISHEQNFNYGRYASAAMLSLAVALIALFMAENFSVLSAIICAGFLALSPPFIAYGRVLGMDSITVLMFTLVTLAFFRFAKSKGRMVDYVWPTIIFGLAINTRYNLVLSILMLPVAVALFAPWRKNIWRWISLLIIPAGALVVFYLTWPFLWQEPLKALNESLGHWGQVKEWYLGQGNVIPPKSYYVTYFLATTPVVVLVMFLLGLFRKPFETKKLFLVMWLLVPFLQSFFGLKQNGIRYLLQSWIPLAAIAALGLEQIFIYLKKFYLKLIVGIAVLSYLVFNVISYYPYYLDYYNEIVGGASGVYERKLLQLGWWGEGGEEAAQYLNDHAPTGATVYVGFSPIHCFGALKDGLKTVQISENPDYIAINPEAMWVRDFKTADNYAIIHEVKAGGAPIVIILEKQ